MPWWSRPSRPSSRNIAFSFRAGGIRRPPIFPLQCLASFATLFVWRKVTRESKWQKPSEVTFFPKERALMEEQEQSLTEKWSTVGP
ncbi:hypothetical protein BDN72DRAFT_848562 [Pluteus cervinus]|uniref:Uncharacterized protein n=1 Tax=Pluteus cervinus TaxID=181527 RepID=A0ACD3AA43_9AGAR|nr:hypothetical protein BDN72DRAFT_848562 [Pluteus cervinus]